jgi:nucleotide-binding universal stress UspA family protein
MLTRHGVKVEVSILAQTLPRASDELLRHAREKGAGLIVVGAYSHSRLREAIFGGATRSLLTKSDIPLLMAH